MPDFANRADWESRLQRALEKLQDAQRKRLMQALGDPPSQNNLPPQFWSEFGQEYRDALYPLLEQIFLDSAEQMLEALPMGVDWDLVNAEAARWARQYTYDLVSQITDRTRAALQEKVGNYFETPTTLGDLKESLEALFGAVRAEMIAVTETTRAAVQGEYALVQKIQEQGIAMVAVWQTNNDDLVCPICAPRNQTRQGEGWDEPPPAHPRCRCWVNHEFDED